MATVQGVRPVDSSARQGTPPPSRPENRNGRKSPNMLSGPQRVPPKERLPRHLTRLFLCGADPRDFYRRLPSAISSFNVILRRRPSWAEARDSSQFHVGEDVATAFLWGKGIGTPKRVRPPTSRKTSLEKGTHATRLAVKSTGYHTNPAASAAHVISATLHRFISTGSAAEDSTPAEPQTLGNWRCDAPTTSQKGRKGTYAPRQVPTKRDTTQKTQNASHRLVSENSTREYSQYPVPVTARATPSIIHGNSCGGKRQGTSPCFPPARTLLNPDPIT